MKRVIVNNVSKKFKIGYAKRQGALARLATRVSGREPQREFWSLRDVSFEAEGGEVVGVIGANGSGKSTLLRVIAGIYAADEGSVKTIGKLVPLISLGSGMQPRMSMRDNIKLCSSLFGMPDEKIRRRFDAVVEFSELEEFLDTKVYQFSDGMKSRLSFSIAMHCDPKVLLIDDILAVGDEHFMKKSTNRVMELVKSGVAVILVTHSLTTVREYCKHAIWLDKGVVMAQGKPGKVINKYNDSVT